MEGRSPWLLIFPLLLIFLGLALLCSNLGIVPGLWDFIWRLWPLLLIAIGLAILLGGQGKWPGRSVARSVPFNEPLGGVQAATLEMSGRVGDFTLAAASANSQDLLGGKMPESIRATVDVSGASARVRFRHEGVALWWPFGGLGGSWNLRLHPEVAWSLTITGGVGQTDLDLTDLRVSSLRLDGGVGEVQVHLPRRGHSQVVIGAGVGDLTLRVPDGLAARIHRPRGSLGSWRVDASRFLQRGAVYESPGFDSAADRVEVRVDRSLGDLRVV